MKEIYFVIGPTASGKTSLSIELARKVGGEVISADSRQIYKDLNLSTGKVTKEEMEGIPHYGLDILNPGEYFSVVDFEKYALEKIQEIHSRNKPVIMCGGTGFYIDSLLYSYELPPAGKNDVLRKELEKKDTSELFEILKQKLFAFKNLRYFFRNSRTYGKFSDPEFGKNRHRLMRAIEIVDSLGYIPTLKKTERFPKDKYRVEIISTNIQKDELKQRIFKRLLERLDAGMIEEIQNVKDKYNLSYRYLEKLGLEFKWVSKYLQNEITKEVMIERLNLEIGQYAKRQVAWFKRYTN
jgi:tRNA dimethylallyltransferase